MIGILVPTRTAGATAHCGRPPGMRVG
jgi:DNA-binding protein H-NS